MKKMLIVLSLLFTPIFCSCSNDNDNKNILTYGVYSQEQGQELTSDVVVDKFDEETFLLAVHPEDGTCGCWTFFKNVISVVTKQNHLLVYQIKIDNINEDLISKGIKKPVKEEPAFYIISKGKILKQYDYDGAGLFVNDQTFVNEVTKYTNLPKLYLIKENQLDSVISSNNNAIIYYYRGKCPDCSYCTPNVLEPYLNVSNKNNVIYAMDLDPIRDSGEESYQLFKDNRFLSSKNNPNYGFSTGVVPTFHYYSNATLTDACIYFNDSIVDGRIQNSYYSSTRTNYLHYIDSLETKILNDILVPDEYLNNDKTYWKDSASQAKYYNPFLTAFLNTYFNK